MQALRYWPEPLAITTRYQTDSKFREKCREARSRNIQIAQRRAYAFDRSTGFASSWEREFARRCERADMPFQYEPLTLRIGLRNRVRYTPDFYLPNQNLFVEIKPRYIIRRNRELWRNVIGATRALGFRIFLLPRDRFHWFFQNYA